MPIVEDVNLNTEIPKKVLVEHHFLRWPTRAGPTQQQVFVLILFVVFDFSSERFLPTDYLVYRIFLSKLSSSFCVPHGRGLNFFPQISDFARVNEEGVCSKNVEQIRIGTDRRPCQRAYCVFHRFLKFSAKYSFTNLFSAKYRLREYKLPQNTESFRIIPQNTIFAKYKYELLFSAQYK